MVRILNLASEIGEKVYELPEAKEYLRLKRLIENNKEIQQLQKQIVSMQNSNNIDEAKDLLSRLNSIPLVINFNIAKEDLANSLREISDVLK